MGELYDFSNILLPRNKLDASASQAKTQLTEMSLPLYPDWMCRARSAS